MVRKPQRVDGAGLWEGSQNKTENRDVKARRGHIQLWSVEQIPGHAGLHTFIMKYVTHYKEYSSKICAKSLGRAGEATSALEACSQEATRNSGISDLFSQCHRKQLRVERAVCLSALSY